MLKNYILVAWRSILKNRLFSVINIVGLALSMSVGMIVLVRIMDAAGYDDFHRDKEKIFRVISVVTNNTGATWELASTPLPLAEVLIRDSSLFESVTALYPVLNDVTSADLKEIDVNGAFVSPDFFETFSFDFRYGNKSGGLTAAFTIVLSEELAMRIYGDTDPIGKMLTLKNMGSFEVTGVVKKDNRKSHIAYGAFASIATVPLLERTNKIPAKLTEWDSFERGYTYVKMAEGTSRTALVSLLETISAEINDNTPEGTFRLKPQPLTSITPSRSDIINEISRGPSRGSLLAEMAIAFIILIAAAINYTNLSVARGLSRGKEVGIRKLSGAKRHQIFLQYILESIIIGLFALLMANVIFALILEYKPFNDGYEMVPSITPGLSVLLVFTAFAVIAGVVAGFMPAWILSAFQPARIFRNVGSENVLGSLSLRKVLMIFQFALSLVIIVFLTVFNRQFVFLSDGDAGFASDNLVMVRGASKPERLQTTLGSLNGVRAVGFTSGAFARRNTNTIKGSSIKDDPTPQNFDLYFCDNSFLQLSSIELVAGSRFSEGITKGEQVLINEKAAIALGFGSAGEAVGSIVYLEDSTRFRVTGVVRDFYQNGFGHPINPLLIRNEPSAFRYTVVQGESAQLATLPKKLETAWKKVYPDYAFEYDWLDKEMKEDEHPDSSASMLGFLGFMTTAISCMGLLGLVVYTCEIRRKEVSIRKIVGASLNQLIVLLSRGFVMLLVIAGVIALPAGYLLGELFLLNFTNKITIGVPDLLIGFFVMLSIGLAIILSQVYAVSMENPSRNLKSE